MLVETPILFDGSDQTASLASWSRWASRNGYSTVLDRVTGKSIVTKPFIETLNWAKGLDAKGQPIPDPKKFPTTDGVLVSPSSNGATNWPAPSYDPETGLFYVGSSRTYSMYYHRHRRPSRRLGRTRQHGDAAAARNNDDYKPATWSENHDSPKATTWPATSRQRAAHYERRQQPDRLQRREWKDPMARGPDGRPKLGRDHLHAGRQAIRSSRGGRWPLRIHRNNRGKSSASARAATPPAAQSQTRSRDRKKRTEHTKS